MGTVLHNLGEGMILVTIILFLFLGNAACRAHRRAHDSVLAAVCVDLARPDEGPRQPALARRARFRHGRRRRRRHGREHRATRGRLKSGDSTKTPMQAIRDACHEVQRPVFYAIAIIITAYMPIFTLQRVEGRLFRPMAWTVAFALLGAMTFSILIAPVLASVFFRNGVKERRQPGDGVPDQPVSEERCAGPSSIGGCRSASASPPWRSRRISASAESSARSSCLTSTRARFGRAARWPSART